MQYGSPFLPLAPSSTLLTPTSFSTAITSYHELFSCIPLLGQGTAAYARIGDYIQPRKCIVDLHAALRDPHDMDARFGTEIWPEDITVHIFFLTSRKVKDPLLASQIDINTLMGFDGHQTSSFDGYLLNADKPVNKADFSVIKRLRFRLRRVNGVPSLVQWTGQQATTGPITDQPLIADSGHTDHRRFKVSIPMPKRLQYKEPSSTQPMNYFPFMCAGFTYNHAPLTQLPSNFLPLTIMASSQLYYTDD